MKRDNWDGRSRAGVGLLLAVLVLAFVACGPIKIPPIVIITPSPPAPPTPEPPKPSPSASPEPPKPSPTVSPSTPPSAPPSPLPSNPPALYVPPRGVQLLPDFEPPQGAPIGGGVARTFVMRVVVDQPEEFRVLDDRRGQVPLWWYAAYPETTCGPGSFNDQDQCGVEHPTRLCDAAEIRDDVARGLPANGCRRADSVRGRDKVGEGGGAPGVIRVCVAPRPDRIAEASCSSWYRDLHGARRESGPVEPDPPKPPVVPVAIPIDPVPVRYPPGTKCRDIAPYLVRIPPDDEGDVFCLAWSSCGSPRDEPNKVCSIVWHEVESGPDSTCRLRGSAYPNPRGNEWDPSGRYPADCDPGSPRGIGDALGRRYRCGQEPSRDTLIDYPRGFSWEWWGQCAPDVSHGAAPPPEPPKPTDPPPPSRDGFVPCDAPWSSLLCPKKNTCPAEWLHAPTRVGLGETPQGHSSSWSGGQPVATRWNLNSTPRDVPPFVPHRGNKGEADQWAPCADAYAAINGPPPMWCEGPAGRFTPGVGGGPYNRFIRVGEGGDGPPGHYVCGIRPHGAKVDENETLREYDFDVRP